MRYRPEHKAEIHRQIVKDASRRIRSEGITGSAVSAVMRDAGLTHGGFYKHFESKDELLQESLSESFQEISDTLIAAAKQARPAEAWKAIVKTYLRPEMCEHPGNGCPLPLLAPELARVGPTMKREVVAELQQYKDRMFPFMPGAKPAERERAFFAIFSTMTGTIAIARLLPKPVQAKVLATLREFLLHSF